MSDLATLLVVVLIFLGGIYLGYLLCLEIIAIYMKQFGGDKERMKNE